MKKSAALIHVWAAEFLATTALEDQNKAVEALHAFLEATKTDVAIRRVLGDASVAVSERVALVERVLDKSLPGSVLAVIRTLMMAQAFNLLPKLVDHVCQLRDRFGVAREVTIVSASAVLPEERERVRTCLEAAWKTPVVLRERIDAQVIGGLQLQANDWYFDATVGGRAERLAQSLIAS